MQPTTHNPKTLIVGAGLAGCTLAWRLHRAGLAFQVIGSSTMPSAAKVAAGIINPVTGRWMTKSWRFDDFAPEAANYYAEIEQMFSIRLYHPLPAVRFCLNADDAKRAKRRCRNPRYDNVLDGFEEVPSENCDFENPHGSFRIEGVAYVDLPLYIQSMRARLLAEGHYEDTVFEHQALKQNESGWFYKGQGYERVIFCEGAALKENPWFNDLPLTPAKGETLLCRSDGLDLHGELHHHGKWLLPYPDGSFRIGATYDESDLTPESTEAAREELCEAFQAMTRRPQALTILDQPAGLRPSTTDARPFLGAHPRKRGLYIFNGLGSKGASLSPTLSRELIEYIHEGKALDPDTDIKRFF
ncbi:NAD(P)/FAD-dependent oxidoreductase [Coraliomargarita sinensis]|uniref:NAD(P)/FAD-dependent oxidoreductase n=1 Tax=Coraliomargarita sinensis TaxID=2174842 RepID=UPI001304CC6A|nr:FAD-dependent oxidoreductase [Coraliomargarita sinensis]